MRVLLLGGSWTPWATLYSYLTGSQLHVTLYPCNPSKSESIVSSAIVEAVAAIVAGDAPDSEGIRKATLGHDIEAVVNVSEGQV